MGKFCEKLDDFIFIRTSTNKSLPGNEEIKKAFGVHIGKTVSISYQKKGKSGEDENYSYVMYCTECNKKFKCICLLKDIQEGGSLKFEILVAIAEDCKCKRVKAVQIRGTERENLMEEMKTKSPALIRKKMFEKPIPADDQLPPTQGTLKKIANEGRRREEMAPDDEILDIYLRMKEKQLDNLKELSIYELKNGEHIRIILSNQHTVEVVERYLRDKTIHFKRFLLDATGKITRPINEKAVLHHVLLAAIPKIAANDGSCHLIPVGEMITTDQTGENIGHFLRFLMKRFSQTAASKLSEIGTDHSWANVHAIFSLTSGLDVKTFLEMSFEYFNCGIMPEKLKNCVKPSFCYSHLSKNWKQDLISCYGKDKINTYRIVRAALCPINDISEVPKLKSYTKSLLLLVNCKFE